MRLKADGANTFSFTNDGVVRGRGSADASTSAAGDGVRIGNPGNAGIAEATISNSGDILATGRQRNGTVYFDGTAQDFTLLNSGAIDARGGAGSGVSIEVGAFNGATQNGRILNSGQIIASGGLAEDSGIRLFSNEASTTFEGDISNFESGFIGRDGHGYAVLVEDNVVFDGALINDGTIDGSVLLNDGDLFLLDNSTLSLDIASLTKFDTVETTGTIIADGILDISFSGSLPTIGQEFDLFDFGFISGEFDLIQSGGIGLDTSDLFTNGTVRVASIPEPATGGLLGLALVAMATRRRRS